jgi:hypothetical protein
MVNAPTLCILSLGAGVQSTTLALMACDGTLPGLDAAIFADTGWEPPAVYEQVDRLEKVLADNGIPLYRVAKGDLRADSIDPAANTRRTAFAAIPYHVRNADGTAGMGQRQCTHEYKLKPVNRKTRELLGANPPHYRRVQRSQVAEMWIGFSTDEIGRVNNKRDVLYIRKRHPLLELGMSRKDCVRWLHAHGWGHTAKSACIGCPLHGNRQWRDLRDNHPDQWTDAVAFDRAIRDGGARALKPGAQAFLHRSLLPLDVAPIDRVTRAEYRDAQLNLFEDGDPDGCSPYGCRSGQPAQDIA